MLDNEPTGGEGDQPTEPTTATQSTEVDPAPAFDAANPEAAAPDPDAEPPAKPLRARRTKTAAGKAPAKTPAKRISRAKAHPVVEGDEAAPQAAPSEAAATNEPPIAAPADTAPSDTTAAATDTPLTDTAPTDTAPPVKAPRKRAPRKTAAKAAKATAVEADGSSLPDGSIGTPLAAVTSPTGEPVTPPHAAAEPVAADFQAPAPQLPAMVAPAPLSALFVAPVDAPAPIFIPASPVDPSRDVHPADGTSDEEEVSAVEPAEEEDAEADESSPRRRRGRRGRGKARGGEDNGTSDSTGNAGKSSGSDSAGAPDQDDVDTTASTDPTGGNADDAEDEGSGTRRRRRRRRRGDEDGETAPAAAKSTGSGANRDSGRDSGRDSARESGRDSGSESNRVRSVSGSVRLEAKRQRRKEGRDAGRRRVPILTEAEFLARRESVDRSMVVRQVGERTQIAVLEDDVLVEHYVTRASAQSFAGGIYLGRVQNVLPSMEAAFVDIGKKRNAVLYAGEVNWGEAGLEGRQRNIEQALKSGDKVLVQVTKDPIGHKGARLTSQISLPGRYLVYVPGGSMTGISRKLPDVERQRLKDILRKIVPEDAGVIIRTAAEGATEEELTLDVRRLTAQWEVIQKKVADQGSVAPSVLYEEPDLAIRVVRDLFNEDFASMTVSGEDAWDTISAYVDHVAPDLRDRVKRYTGTSDVFAENRIDEQLMKALDRKVYLPSGGSLVIDNTEAMTVIDVNTGKFTGSGGNLEQTVTRNNLEAAEEIVRQLRLRDVGGIVVIDFIDMVLESNRELVLRRLTECLGRDRTKHQVAEVTSLGLVQMTRKRVGQGLLDAFSEPCEHCGGRGVIVHTEPVDRPGNSDSDHGDTGRDDRGGRDSSSGGGDRPRGRRDRGSGRGRSDSQPDKVVETRRESKANQIKAASQAKAAEAEHVSESAVEVVATTPDTAAKTEADAPQTAVTTAPEPEADPGLTETSASPWQPPQHPQDVTETPAEATEPGGDAAQQTHVEPATTSDAQAAPASDDAQTSDVDESPAFPVEATSPVVAVAPQRRRRAARRPAGPPSSVASHAEAGS